MSKLHQNLFHKQVLKKHIFHVTKSSIWCVHKSGKNHSPNCSCRPIRESSTTRNTVATGTNTTKIFNYFRIILITKVERHDHFTRFRVGCSSISVANFSQVMRCRLTLLPAGNHSILPLLNIIVPSFLLLERTSNSTSLERTEALGLLIIMW